MFKYLQKKSLKKKKTFGNAVAINQSRVNESAIKTGCLRGGGKVERGGEERRYGGGGGMPQVEAYLGQL